MSVIKARFNHSFCTTACGLTQWDYGQVLEITGIPTEGKNVELHFSMTNHYGSAGRVLVQPEAGIITAAIPDSFLQDETKHRSYSIYCFVFLTSADSGETVFQVILPVRLRPKPEEFEPSPEHLDLIAQLRMEMQGIAGVQLGNGLIYDEAGRISVETTDSAEEDNTLPISSAAVHVQLGNINSLLKTI